MLISAKTILNKIMQYLDENLRKEIMNLNDEERKVLEYFIQYVSVGSVIAVKELRALYGIEDPNVVIRNLMNKGLLERGLGCYNLAKPLRDAILKAIRAKKL